MFVSWRKVGVRKMVVRLEFCSQGKQVSFSELNTDMPVCCRCSGRGRCIACSCVKCGSRCVDCLPARNGHCSNLESTIDVASDGEHSRTLLPSPMRQSTTPDATPEAIAESAPDDNPDFDFVGAMLDDVIAAPSSTGSGSGSESDVDQAPNYFLPSFRPTVGTDYTRLKKH